MEALLSKPARRKKAEEVERLTEYLKQYNVVALVDLTGIRANILHEFRRRLRGKAVLRVTKKTLLELAAEKAGRQNLKRFLEDLKTPIGLILTNINPFSLKLEIDKSRILVHARAGEKADVDVVIPEMSTGLPPGPILSEFGKMKIPTKIEGGQIWIARETLVAKKGDEISPALASLLVRLDIPCVMKGLNLIAMFDGELLISKEYLELDFESYKQDLIAAHRDALLLSIEVAYPLKENVEILLAKAQREATALAVNAAIPEPETIKLLLAKAEAEVLKLQSLIPNQ